MKQTMIDIQDIKDGDVFVEYYSRSRIVYQAEHNARRNKEDTGWEVYGKILDDNSEKPGIVYFFSHDKYPAYKPQLYSE